MALALTVIAAACTPEEASAPDAAAPSIEVAPTLVEADDTTPTPEPNPVGPSASQSPQEALRDGVVPELAAVPVNQRVTSMARRPGEGGSWVLSQPSPLVSLPVSAVGYYGYGELLFLDESGDIELAVPMNNAIPDWLYVADDAIYAGRSNADGAVGVGVVRVVLSSGRVDKIAVTGTSFDDSWIRLPEGDVLFRSAGLQLVAHNPADGYVEIATTFPASRFIDPDKLDAFFDDVLAAGSAVEDIEVVAQLGAMPGSAFEFYVEYDGPVWSLGTIFATNGNETWPALNDERDRFRNISEFSLSPDGLVAWRSGNGGRDRHIGRIDDAGRIIDAHTLPFDTTGYDSRTDPFFVMSSPHPVRIDTASPLLPILDEGDYWNLADDAGEGFWYVGDTLSSDPACGASTLYRDDPDGFARVLDANSELDTVTQIVASASLDTGGIDGVGRSRVIAIATECPESYNGNRVWLAHDSVSYGDGGPRTQFPLRLQEVVITDGVAKILSVTAELRDPAAPFEGLAPIEIRVEMIDGTEQLLTVQQ